MRLILFMIVKNESRVISRCLESVKPYIDGWCICDTGSTDGTQAIIRSSLKGIKGEVYDRPWVDFASNRNEALDLAKELFPDADYLMTIDADEILLKADFSKLEADSHPFRYLHGSLEFDRTSVVSAKQPWKFVGVLHEYLDLEDEVKEGVSVGVVKTSREGSRSDDPKKYEKDAEILKKALQQEPNNKRYQFYLAQSLRDAGLFRESYDAYKVRATMGGWVEEIWQSWYQRGILAEQLGLDPMPDYIKALEILPKRAETYGRAAAWLRANKNFGQAYIWAKAGVTLKPYPEALFLEPKYYTWGCKDEASVAAYWTNRFLEGLNLTSDLLAGEDLPKEQRRRVQDNLNFCKSKL